MNLTGWVLLFDVLIGLASFAAGYYFRPAIDQFFRR